MLLLLFINNQEYHDDNCTDCMNRVPCQLLMFNFTRQNTKTNTNFRSHFCSEFSCLDSCTMNDTCRYIATGDSIPLPLLLPLLEGDERGRERGSVRGSGKEGARVVIWDASTLCVVATIQISSSIATGTSSNQIENHISFHSHLLHFILFDLLVQLFTDY